MRKTIFLFQIFIVLTLVGCTQRFPNPIAKTTKVIGDADECAFWNDFSNPSQSVLIGNDKSENGALYVWDLDGEFISKTEPLNRPVGVDVRYDMKMQDKNVDIVVCAIRSTNEIKVFEIDPNKRELIDITTDQKILSNFKKDTYGLALYKRASDGEIFAFVSSKAKDNIHQIHLKDDGVGRVEGQLIRSFGKKDIKSFVEGMVADDANGFVYFSDETTAILKYIADPNKNDNKLVSKFAEKDGIKGDREGLALYKVDDTTGYLILSSQGNSTFKIYQREDDNKFIKTIAPKGVKNTDGIAITNMSIMPNYPKGIFAAHNGSGKNFILYDWQEFFNQSSK